MGGQRHAPAALPPGKTRYPLYRRLGGPLSRSGRVRKISPPTPEFDPRTVHSVAIYYTDWAIPTHIIIIIIVIVWNIFIVLQEPRYCDSDEKYIEEVQLSYERTYRYDGQY